MLASFIFSEMNIRKSQAQNVSIYPQFFLFLRSYSLQHPEGPCCFLAFTENYLFLEGLMHPDQLSLFSNGSIPIVRKRSRSIGHRINPIAVL